MRDKILRRISVRGSVRMSVTGCVWWWVRDSVQSPVGKLQYLSRALRREVFTRCSK
jgi:hypothetical protein